MNDRSARTKTLAARGARRVAIFALMTLGLAPLPPQPALLHHVAAKGTSAVGTNVEKEDGACLAGGPADGTFAAPLEPQAEVTLDGIQPAEQNWNGGASYAVCEYHNVSPGDEDTGSGVDVCEIICTVSPPPSITFENFATYIPDAATNCQGMMIGYVDWSLVGPGGLTESWRALYTFAGAFLGAGSLPGHGSFVLTDIVETDDTGETPVVSGPTIGNADGLGQGAAVILEDVTDDGDNPLPLNDAGSESFYPPAPFVGHASPCIWTDVSGIGLADIGLAWNTEQNSA